MVDFVSKEKRSRIMAGSRSRNTKPEILMRKALHRQGFRYGLHTRGLPGSPDLLLRRWGVVVFVHGCFWHHHEGCQYATKPSSRTEFWQDKFKKNVERDARNIDELRAMGWRVFVVWECGVKHDLDKMVSRLEKAIRNPRQKFLEIPKTPPRKKESR